MDIDLTKLTNLIIEEAKNKAEIIIEEAEKEKKYFIEIKRQEALQIPEEEKNRLTKRIEDAKLTNERIIADAKLKANWLVLEEKQKLVDQVIQSLKKELNNYAKSNKYNNMLNELIITSGLVIRGGQLIVTLNKEDQNKVNLVELAQKISIETKTETSLTLSNEYHSDYGVIVKSIDGKILLNNLFSLILDRIDNQLRYKAAKILFT
ncbi:hypothetical protein FJY84_01165 [Candidatus Bathyarchaeota archaeon]|nr:hypothetical protein [Candidatus Bathyarchaeota archaeon]